jgi:hypothetical protein
MEKLAWFCAMPDRRDFLKNGLSTLVGSALALLALPQFSKSAPVNVSAIGEKQLRLLLASKALLEKTGMLRASWISHYALDGEIQMDWSVSIPGEEKITPEIENLARQVLLLVNQ